MGEERAWTDLVVRVQIFRANVVIFVKGDEIKCAKRVEGWDLHLEDIIETFKPCGKADASKRRVVQMELDVVNLHGVGHVGR